MRRGVLGSLFKLLLYGGIAFVALTVVYPAMLEDPQIRAGLQSAKLAAETGTTVDVDTVDVQQLERRVHHYVNQQRTARGLDSLSYDMELASIARGYSEDMAQGGFFSHFSPTGEDFSDRYAEAGYDCRVRVENKIYKGGENLAKNYIGRPVIVGDGREIYTTPDQLARAVVTGWMNSPEHRENMLKPFWRREGIGAHLKQDGTVYVTQNFC